MANELIINASLPETRIALMEDGEIQELLVERASGKGIVGNIYKGRVTRVLPGMQAAFVDIGLDKAAFLYVDDVHVHTDELGELAPLEEMPMPVQGILPGMEALADESPVLEGIPEPAVVVEPVLAVEGEVIADETQGELFIEGEEQPKKHKKRFRKTHEEEDYPASYQEQLDDTGFPESDRAGIDAEPDDKVEVAPRRHHNEKKAFQAPRARDRRVRQKATLRPAKAVVNIQDLLKEGQEVLVQIAKDPIATKGARLTCHISLPGRHLVCMPTIDHVGVSRRIERDDERRRLREYVERNRPKELGFIVRTASGKQQSERRIKQDIEYLTHLWTEIQAKAATVSAPAMVYEDLDAVLRAVRDWVTEETDKVIVDSRIHFQDIQKFVAHFMPSLKQKIELYHGDIPIFDAYAISTELSRALERKVWLKSGGYIVIDQAEALVAIDVNTGRYVGKKNLEDTILKTNLEAVKEIAYQLRLRNCGGIIILDLIDMEKEENKHRVYRALEDAIQKDRARPSILKISELGLVEMTRKRTRDTIIRSLCESCSHCEGKGFVKSKQTVAYEAMREMEREGIEREISKIMVQAHPDVIDILAIDERDTLDMIEKRYKKVIYLQSVADFHAEQFEVLSEKKTAAKRPEPKPKAQRVRVVVPPVEPSAQVLPVIRPRPVEAVATPAVATDPHEEEDRLAFLRAQAAQDAALARLSHARGGGGDSQGNSPAPLGQARRSLRGRRGGKFRRGGQHGKRDAGQPEPTDTPDQT